MKRFQVREARGSSRHPAHGAGRWLTAIWMLGLVAFHDVACSRLGPKRAQPPPVVVQEPADTESLERVAGFHHALMLLGEGKWAESRGILAGLMQAQDPCDLCPRVYFYIGLLDLLEMEDSSQMEPCRDYMRAYPQKYPQGPFLMHAERIAQILDRQIESRRKEQQRLKTLNQKVQGLKTLSQKVQELKTLSQKVQEQSEEIDTLKFQIQKLEEITRETEETRENIETKGKEASPMPDVNGVQ